MSSSAAGTGPDATAEDDLPEPGECGRPEAQSARQIWELAAWTRTLTGDLRSTASRADLPSRRPPRSAARAAAPAGSPASSGCVSGPYLVTVNPVDGSEIEPCPPGERPDAPGRLDPQERAAAARAAAPPLPPGPPGFAGHEAALEERTEDTERLVRLLSRGRSVRVTGPSGSGRTRLLDAVAAGCADLAPDGVIRLSGYHRTATDLLYELFTAVYRAPQHRPDRPELLRMIAEIGAIVVLDDLEFGGAALDELLDATPECAFLIAATPDVAAPSADSHLEEVFLGGLGRDACARLLARAVDRPLTDDEEAWAADLWFESEGLPLRFVQAAALLRQYDRMRAGPGALDDGYGLFPEAGTTAFPGTAALPEKGTATDPAGPDVEPGERPEVLLPSLGEAAAPAPLLAARLGAAAQETLRFAVALGGELPHQAHLPALTQDTHADAALGELLACGLITPVGSHYRLAATVQDQLDGGRLRGGRRRTGAHRGPALRLVGRSPLGHPRAGRRRVRCGAGRDGRTDRQPGERARQRGRAARPYGRPGIRRRVAVERLGAQPAARPGGRAAGRRGRRRGLLPPRAGCAGTVHRQPRPGARRAGGVHRAARGALRPQRRGGRTACPGTGHRPFAGRRGRGRHHGPAAGGRAAARRRRAGP